MKKIVNSLEECIGQTPLVRMKKSLQSVSAGKWLKENHPSCENNSIKAEVLAKIEYMNPGGSVKDRIAQFIINGLEKEGKLKPGGTIVEATSGNTGAGLALCAAIRGYKAILVMPDKISSEKINALRAYGADVRICPTKVEPDHPDSYYSISKKLSEEIDGAVLANQYFNPDNPKAHYESTGPEIWEQCDGKIDAFVCGIGTGGTISGIGQYLKEKNPDIKIIAVDPYGSIYHDKIVHQKDVEAHSYFVEGVGEDMIPGTIDMKLIDACVQVTDKESFETTLELSSQEALFVGGSCGLAYFGALQWLKSVEQKDGMRVVVLLPDSGSRYLSKAYSPEWLSGHEILSASEVSSRVGAVEYIGSALKVEGV